MKEWIIKTTMYIVKIIVVSGRLCKLVVKLLSTVKDVDDDFAEKIPKQSE